MSKANHRFSGILLALLSGYLHYVHVSNLNENHVHFSHLTTLERELYFRTEMGFYYSYFKQIIQGPNLHDGIKSLLHDDLTEFPDTINAINRFNLIPEVLIGAIYRLLQPMLNKQCNRIYRHYGDSTKQVTSCVGMGEPPYFYCEVVFLLSGFMMMGFVLLAQACGNISTGILAVCAFFFHHDQCTRVMWTPPLREHFSMPMFMWQQLALVSALKDNAKTPGIVIRNLFVVMVTTVSFLLPWQFAQFVVAMEACALFGCHILGVLEASHLRRLLSCLMLAGIMSGILQMGNMLLVTGLLPTTLASTMILSMLGLNHRFGLMARVMMAGVLFVLVMFIIKHVLDVLVGVERSGDGSHIWQILWAKYDSKLHTFDTKLYLCAPEFGFYDLESVWQLTRGLVLPMALITIFSLVRHFARNRAVTASNVFVLLLLFAFAVLAGLISRLKVLFTPQLVLVASMILNVCPISDEYYNHVLVALIASMSIEGLSNLVRQYEIVGEYSNVALQEVVEWILANTSPMNSFVGPMTIMATVRETTFRPIYNHPHYENAALRKRTRHAYSIYSRKPIEDLWNIYKQNVGVDYLVVEKRLCLFGEPGCRFRDVWDVEDVGNASMVPACESVYNGTGLEPYFHIVFENEVYTILEIAQLVLDK